MPESKVRFRVTEVCGSANLESSIDLEYMRFNEAMDIYCDLKDELSVRKFLSPAVQGVLMKLSDDLPDMNIDFFPGFVMIVSSYDFFEGVDRFKLDENTYDFQEKIKPGIDKIEQFREYIRNEFSQVQKYNDNY